MKMDEREISKTAWHGVIVNGRYGNLLGMGGNMDNAVKHLHEIFCKLLAEESLDFDAALIKIDSSFNNFPAAKIGISDDVIIGEEVVAIGYPLALGSHSK